MLDYLKVTWQNLKEILLTAIRGTLLVIIFALIGGGLGYLLAAHPTIWVRSIVVVLMIFCFIIWVTLWDPCCCSYNRRRYLGMNKH
jgi:hypothetical protein